MFDKVSNICIYTYFCRKVLKTGPWYNKTNPQTHKGSNFRLRKSQIWLQVDLCILYVLLGHWYAAWLLRTFPVHTAKRWPIIAPDIGWTEVTSEAGEVDKLSFQVHLRYALWGWGLASRSAIWAPICSAFLLVRWQLGHRRVWRFCP